MNILGYVLIFIFIFLLPHNAISSGVLMLDDGVGPNTAPFSATCDGWTFSGSCSCLDGAIRCTDGAGVATSPTIITTNRRYLFSYTATLLGSDVRVGGGGFYLLHTYGVGEFSNIARRQGTSGKPAITHQSTTVGETIVSGVAFRPFINSSDVIQTRSVIKINGNIVLSTNNR